MLSVVDAGLQVLGLGLVLVRDHRQAGEDQRAGGEQREAAADAAEAAPGVSSVAAVAVGGRLGGWCSSSGSFRGSFVGVRATQTFPAPRPGPPGTAVPTFRAARPARSGGVSLPCRGRTPVRMSAVPGPTDPRAPAPGVPRWVPGLLAALGVGCTLAARRAWAPWSTAARPVDAGDAVLGLLYPLVGGPGAAPAAGQPGRLAAHGQRRHRPLSAGRRVHGAGRHHRGPGPHVRRLAGRLGVRPLLRDRRAGAAVLPRRHPALAAVAADRPVAHHRGRRRHGRRDVPRRPARLRPER